METFQSNFTQKEYFNKSDKFYLHDNYHQFIAWVKNDVKIDPKLVLPLFPLEKAYISKEENDSELASEMKKYIIANKRFFSLKRAQWHLFLQKECSPQLIPQTKSFLNRFIKFDFSKDFLFVSNNLDYEISNALSLSLKFLDAKAYNTQIPRFKKIFARRIANKLLHEDIKWSSIPDFIKKDASFLVQISSFATINLETTEFEEYKKFILNGKFNQDLNFISRLKDDGYLALTLGDKKLHKTNKFWLTIAKQYKSFERESNLEQSDYEDFFWKQVPQEIKCNKQFLSSLNRIFTDINSKK